MTDTIVAVATPIGRSGVGVVRLSGPRALSITQKMWRSHKETNIEPRYLHLGWLYDGKNRLDQAFLVSMPAPHSYTGEDVVELQTHGSPVVLDWIMQYSQKHGARLAEPGEFTKRAYLNGKIDITQAEAVNDVIQAESLAAVRTATDQLAGSLSSAIEEISSQLIGISAAETAYLDFGDEDIVGQSGKELSRQLQTIKYAIDELLLQQKEAQLLRDGVKVALIGLPNAGKSTLLNKLLSYERSIVTNIAGTTRDHIEENIVISNVPIRLIDTAGLSKSQNKVEQIGVKKSQSLLRAADIILLLIEPSRASQTHDYLAAEKLLPHLNESNTIIVQTKQDLPVPKDIKDVFKGYQIIAISASKNLGIEAFKRLLVQVAKRQINSESAIQSARRHSLLLKKASQNINSALKLIKHNSSRDIVLVEIDEAITSLNELRGADIDQAKIDTMFANFCIGK